MAGLDPAIHVFLRQQQEEVVDARVKPGHDEITYCRFLIPLYMIYIIS